MLALPTPPPHHHLPQNRLLPTHRKLRYAHLNEQTSELYHNLTTFVITPQRNIETEQATRHIITTLHSKTCIFLYETWYDWSSCYVCSYFSTFWSLDQTFRNFRYLYIIFSSQKSHPISLKHSLFRLLRLKKQFLVSCPLYFQ